MAERKAKVVIGDALERVLDVFCESPEIALPIVLLFLCFGGVVLLVVQ